MSKPVVLNILSGPGAGKSTTAAGLFVKMKIAGYKVELLNEYAKDLVYAERTNVLDNDQMYVFAKQQYKLSNIAKAVDYVITDSSLLFSLVYSADQTSTTFKNLVVESFYQFNNFNVRLYRPSTYQSYGRMHSQSESNEIDQKIDDMIFRYNICVDCTVYANENTVDDIFDKFTHTYT